MPLCRATVAHRVQAQTLLPSPMHRLRRAFRNSPRHSCAPSFTFDRPRAVVLDVQLRSRHTATQHAVACRQMLSQSYSPKVRSSPRRRCPRDQRFARVLLPSHLCAQAASHSTADKCRHACCAWTPANRHQKMHKPLTFDKKQTPHFSCCGAPIPKYRK